MNTFNVILIFQDMPKTKKGQGDQDFTPGFSRKTGLYDRRRDNRSIKKQLNKLKCRRINTSSVKQDDLI